LLIDDAGLGRRAVLSRPLFALVGCRFVTHNSYLPARRRPLTSMDRPEASGDSSDDRCGDPSVLWDAVWQRSTEVFSSSSGLW
jgi:hypothetical protein